MVVDASPARRSRRRNAAIARRVGGAAIALAGKGAAQRRDRLGRQPHRAHAVIAADLDDQPRDGRMQMHVLVRVDMVEREPGGAERLELRADLAPRAGARMPGRKKKRNPARSHGCRRTGRRAPTRPAISAGGSTGAPSTSTSAARPAAPASGGRAPPRRPRPARATIRLAVDRMPSPMRLLDRLVDRDIEAEIVGADDQPPMRPRRRHSTGCHCERSEAISRRTRACADRDCFVAALLAMTAKLLSPPSPAGAGTGRTRRPRAGGGASSPGS